MEAIGNPGGRPADDPKTPIRSNPQSLDQREHRPSLYLLLLFLVLAAGIITAGYLFYRSYARNFRGEVERGLSSIAELKVGQLVQWRKERLMDASFLYRNPAFSALVSRYLRNPADAGGHDGLQAWLENYIGYYQYDRASLLDARGVERMSAPETPNRIGSIISRRTSEILRSGQPVIQDFYRNENDGKIYLSVLAPIFDEQERDLPLGVVVLLIDPATYLYPFIQQWPTPSRTAETLLVRREGDEALFLNELRFRKNSALNLRVPLDKGDVPAVKAALGQKGIVEGVDYRGVPVVADVRGIPDSPWFLVARMDTTEAFKPMHERRWLIIGLVAVLLFGAGTGAGLIWRQQRLRFFRERLAAAETLRLSYERFLLANRATYNAIWDWDLRTNALWWNENFQTLFGYGAEEIELGIESWTKRIHPEDLERVQTGIHETIDSGRHSWSDQYRFRRKDGRYAVVDDRGYIVRQADGSPVRMIGAMQDITERMQAEEKLRESEEKYRAFIETNQEWIWQINNEGIHTYSNPAIEQILGYSIKDIVGKNATIHMHPEDRREIEEMLPKWIKNKKGWNNLVLRWLHKDGSIRWLESNAVVMLDVNGELIGFRGSDRDITERKRADEAVRKSEEKYRGLTENVNLGIYRNTVGPKGKFIEANPALVGMFEYKSKEEFLAINVSDLYQNAEGRNKFNDKMLKEEFVKDEELWLRTKDGSPFFGSVSAVAVKDKQGHVKYYDGIIDNITERKWAEEALKKSEEHFRALTENASDMIIILDKKGTITYTSPSIERFSGYKPEELIGKKGFDFIKPVDLPRAMYDFGKAILARETVIPDTFRMRHKDGSERIFDGLGKNLLDNPAITGFVMNVRDITERKRAEEERTRLLADLEAKNRELESFVYTISHDLKAPLVSLNGFSSVLQKKYESQLGEEGKHCLERIQANVAHMEALITSLLELSRIGQVVGPIEEIDVAALLRKIRDALAIRLKEAGAEFVVQEPLPTVRADRSRIHQVFANLIDNAVKFRSTERALRIEVGCRQESGFYRFHVTDNGIGIAPQFHEQIFAPFRKLHPEIEGAGIGLALVKKIVEHHGGRAWVESTSAKFIPSKAEGIGTGNEEAGATFYFTLPIERGVNVSI